MKQLVLHRLAFALFVLFICMIAGALIGCNPVKKFMQSDGFAKACADSFPCIDTIVSIEQVTKYDTTRSVDTATIVQVDTVTNTRIVTKVVTQYVTKTVKEVQQVIRIDSARIRDLRNANSNITADRDKWKDKAQRRGKSFMWSIIGNALLLIAIGLLIRFKIR